MANNPYVNKVQLADGSVLVDLTSDTVTADKLMSGFTAHGADGSEITGTASGFVQVSETPDIHGGTIISISSAHTADWEGVDRELVSTLISQNLTLADIGWTSWTPTTTQTTIKSSETTSVTAQLDLANYDYCLKYVLKIEFAYAQGTEMKYCITKECTLTPIIIFRYTTDFTNYLAGTRNTNTAETFNSNVCYLRYNSSGSESFYASNCGIYITGANPAFSSTSSATPTITIKTPVYYARCDNSIFTTDKAEAVDATNTTVHLDVKLYRYKANSSFRSGGRSESVELLRSMT